MQRSGRVVRDGINAAGVVPAEGDRSGHKPREDPAPVRGACKIPRHLHHVVCHGNPSVRCGTR